MVKEIREILKVFADSNLFDEGVELIGSWCFKLYQDHLGAKPFPLVTQDIDFLVPNPFKGKEQRDFLKKLEDLGFNYDFNRDGSLYLWNAELKIEFITPEKGRDSDEAIKIKKLGIAAIPLRFVLMLLDDPIKITEDGINVLVPNPANFCLHKLIIASRRKKLDKSLKDLQQAICTSVIVNEKELLTLFESLPNKWQQTVKNMLKKSKEELVLYIDEINSLERTLQINDKSSL